MRRRPATALVAFGGLVIAGLLAYSLWPRASRIDREHYDALAEGVSRVEVEQLLGGPPRNECPGPADVWVPRGDKRRSAELVPGGPAPHFFHDEGEQAVWVGPEGLIAAQFDDGRLRAKYFSTVHPLGRPTLVDAIRHVFGY